MGTAKSDSLDAGWMGYSRTLAESNYSIRDVECMLMHVYASSNGLATREGSFLSLDIDRGSKLLDGAEPPPKQVFTLPELVMCMETLVPDEQAREYGANYTPSEVSMFMAREGVKRLQQAGHDLHEVRVLDPACGCGALLLASLLTLHEETGETPSSIVSRFTGVDISADSVRQARYLLQLACLSLGDGSEANPSFIVGSSLDKDSPIPRDSFHLVIANPPYVRFQRLPMDTRAYLSSTYESCREGNYNLFFPFFEAGMAATALEGVLVYITPNGFFTSLSAGPLRRWFARNNAIDEILDFEHSRVFQAMTYTAITFMSRKSARNDTHALGYATVDGVDGLGKIPAGWENKETIPVVLDPESVKAWRLVGRRHAATVALIANQPRRLSDIADTRFGVATCRDGLYLLSGEEREGMLVKKTGDTVHLIERDVTRLCLKVSGLHNEEDLRRSRSRILYPYHLVNGTAVIIPESELADKYPSAYAYLVSVRTELAKRDNGRKEYAAWYAYGRTQGLVPTGVKLVSPLYAGDPRFMLSSSPDSLIINGISVTLKPAITDVPLEVLQAILNSGLTKTFVESTAVAINGGYYAYQKKQIADIGVPVLNDKDITDILSAVQGGQRDDILRRAYRHSTVSR